MSGNGIFCLNRTKVNFSPNRFSHLFGGSTFLQYQLKEGYKLDGAWKGAKELGVIWNTSCNRELGGATPQILKHILAKASCLYHTILLKITQFQGFSILNLWEFSHIWWVLMGFDAFFSISHGFFKCRRCQDALDHYVSTCGGTKVGFDGLQWSEVDFCCWDFYHG